MMATSTLAELREIPIDLIDPPSIAMREQMSDSGLEALASSMRQHGQLQNIGVIVAGDRYRVAYGHRRRVAASLAGLATLIARVFPEGTTDEEAIKVDENEEQEPVNAAAQATYYRELLDKRCNGDVTRLCGLVRRSEQFVLGRLDLTRGDPEVLNALRRGSINLSVATELNKVHEDMYRRLFLHDACAQGLNARAVRELRQRRERDRHVTEALTPAGVGELPPSSEPSMVHMDACAFCLNPSDQHEMTYVKVHRSCRDVWMREKLARGGVE